MSPSHRAGAVWKIDVWFVDEPDLQPDLEHVRALPPRLTDAARLAILRIKEVWAGRPGYRSYDVYTAVLDSGVTLLKSSRSGVREGWDDRRGAAVAAPGGRCRSVG